MIYLLLFTIIVLFLISYFVVRDIFHPVCLMCLTFSLSVFCAILNIEKWTIDLSGKTILIIIIGIISFLIPGLIAYKKFKTTDDRVKDSNYIKYNQTIMFILVIIQLIILLLFALWTANNIGGISKIFDISAMSKYRFEKSFDQEINMPSYISQGIKFTKALIYIFSFIEIHNKILSNKRNEKKKINILYILSLIMFAIQTILSGGRSDLVILFISILTMIFMFDCYYSNKAGVKLGKNIVKIIIVTALLLYVFSITRTLVGRTADDNFIDYVTRYFGGPIELFDLYIKNPIAKSDIFGKETLFGINKFLGQIGIIDFPYTLHLEFRSVNGEVLGNVYTCFRRFYQDFGYFGVISLNLLFGWIMTKYYNNIKNSKAIGKLSIYNIFYFMIIHCVILAPFSDFFYSTVLSINYINIVIYMLIIIILLIKLRIKRDIHE